MPIKKVEIEAFLELAQQHPVLDVRSPGEYLHAHIPAAHSFPLFTDEERKVVGTTYKQTSREKAIKIGLDYFGPKMREMIETAEAIAKKAETKTLLVHCWRGGMRSGAISWLLDLYGFEVYQLIGGYKSYRNWVLQSFDKYQLPFLVIGGYTGTGKTEILQWLKEKDEFVINLEEIAGHRGSAFGNLGLPEQAGVEQVENILSLTVKQYHYSLKNSGKKWIWLEDESRRIGNINLPEAFHKNMKNSPFIFLQVPFDKRLENIVNLYGQFSTESLENSILRIKKRMGNDLNGIALEFLHQNDIKNCFRILLNYYDRYYLKNSFQYARKTMELDPMTYDTEKIADYLITIKDKLYEFSRR